MPAPPGVRGRIFRNTPRCTVPYTRDVFPVTASPKILAPCALHDLAQVVSRLGLCDLHSEDDNYEPSPAHFLLQDKGRNKNFWPFLGTGTAWKAWTCAYLPNEKWESKQWKIDNFFYRLTQVLSVEWASRIMIPIFEEVKKGLLAAVLQQHVDIFRILKVLQETEQWEQN